MQKPNPQLIKNLIQQLRHIAMDIDGLRSEEEDYMWNIPENLQESDRYYAADAAVDNLDSASERVSDAADELEELLKEVDHE